MKYVRIEETRRIAVEKAMTKVLEETRAYVKTVEEMEITKYDCNTIINDFFYDITRIIEENDLAEVAVTVWNKDTVNPKNIDRKLIDVMWDYRAEAYFIIKKKTRRDQLMNRLYRLVDYVKILMAGADRVGEMEGTEVTNENSRYEKHIEEVTEELTEEVTEEVTEELTDEWLDPENPEDAKKIEELFGRGVSSTPAEIGRQITIDDLMKGEC